MIGHIQAVAKKQQRFFHPFYRYSEPHYLEALQTVGELTSRNYHLSQFCRTRKHGNELCTNRQFLVSACRLFPWKVMKLVRLKLSLLKPILEDEIYSNTQVILLVRDPRGVMNSRKATVSWCTKGSDECSSPQVLCSDLEQDFATAEEFHRLFPNKFHLLRYEDMANDPFTVTEKLLLDLGLDFSKEIRNFLAEHTTVNIDKPWSTTRDSKKRLMFWTQNMKMADVSDIQQVCGLAMQKLGYKTVNSLYNLNITDVIRSLDSNQVPFSVT